MNIKIVKDLSIKLKRLLIEETELSKKIKNFSISLTKDSYLEQRSLYIESGYLTIQKIDILKELCSFGVPINNYIETSEDYLDFLLDSLVELDHKYKKARNIVISQINSGKIDKGCQELSLLDIEFDY